MRLNDRLIKENREEEERKKRKRRDFYTDEETLSYMPYVSQGFINENRSVFKGFGDTGINNAPSIYDSQAIFKTREE